MVLTAWIVLVFAGLYAQSLILSQSILPGLLVYLAVGSLAALLFYGWKPLPTSPPQEGPPDPSPSWVKILRWVFLPLTLITLCASTLFIYKGSVGNPPNPLFYSYALQSWLAFLVLAFIGIALAAWNDLRRYPKRSLVPLAGLLLLSLLIGLYRLTETPPTVHGDEGMVGLFARKILQGEIATFFSTSWYSIPQFFFFIPSCGLYLFGDNLWGLRMSTVIVGTLSVIPFYLLVRHWWGTRAAIFAGLLLITNHWFIHLLHCGVNYVQVSFFTITLMALWTYSNTRRSLEALLASGAVMGLSLLSYQANHLLPILWVASQFYLFILRKIPFRWLLLSASAPILIAVLTISPLLINDFSTEGQTELFSARSSGVVIWTPRNQQHVNGVYKANGDMSLVLREQIKRALLSPILQTDTSIQYNGQMPFLDRIGAALFMMSLGIAAYRFFEPRWSIPVLWIAGVLLAGGALTVDAPFYPRLAGIATLLFIPIAGLFSQLFALTKRKNTISAQLAAFLPIILCAGINLHYYFYEYSNSHNIQSVHYAQTQMAKLINEKYSDRYIYVFDGPHFTFNSGTVQFLIHSQSGEDLDQIPAVWKNSKCAIFISASRSDLLPALKEHFPSSIMQDYQTPDGARMFTTLIQDTSP